MRSRLTDSSNMMLHLRWCCCRSGSCLRLATPSCSSFIATENSVTVQFRVLNSRFRKPRSSSTSSWHVSLTRCWKAVDGWSDLEPCELLACAKPLPRHSRRRMLLTGIQNRASNVLSSAGTIALLASSFPSKACTYSLYCSSTEMHCSSVSRMSGFTILASEKWSTRKETRPLRPVSNAAAEGWKGGSPLLRAWNESTSVST
mmetsp:Transcript_16570/g.56496  ORF Transcript_16570/g.56496 Transcript_16570/m.56496 type:complete len:202 (-) Transcript_16570:2211-2816(-)